jgi:photosystem II stability/assembly factor-like uncharacterized protein
LNFTSLNAQWVQCNNGLGGGRLFGMAINGKNIFAIFSTYAGYEGGIYMSSDNGNNWIPKNNDITDLEIRAIFVSDTNIFVGTEFGNIFLSTNNGDNWIHKKVLPIETWITTLNISGTNILAGTVDSGIFFSTDLGNNWIKKNEGLPFNIIVITRNEDNIFAGTYSSGIFRSTDKDSNWISVNNGLKYYYVASFAKDSNNLYAGTENGGIFFSNDNGNTWSLLDPGIDVSLVLSLLIKDNYIIAGTGSGIILSNDKGKHWYQKNTGLDLIVQAVIINNEYIFAGTSDSGIYRAKLSDLGITDVKETNQNNETIIYPNPASSSVRVKYESPSYSKLQISIFDLLGNEVYSSSEDCNIGMNEKTIDCRSLETGYYIIRLKQGERVKAKPVLIIKN